MNTTLKNLAFSSVHAIDLHQLVKAASRVIAPYGPITAFAARSPWAGWEHMQFDKAAERLKRWCDVDILPSEAMIQAAISSHHIDQQELKAALHRWLESQALDIPQEIQEQFGWALLNDNKEYAADIDPGHVKTVSKRLRRLASHLAGPSIVETHSQKTERLGIDNTGERLNHQMMKWCKLYLDDQQAAWPMPHREKGFYGAWKRLSPHDPALPRSLRQRLKALPENAEQALKKALVDLHIRPEESRQYLEAHLLALPGWAGMLLWMAEENGDDHLLIDYLAIRLSLEAFLIPPELIETPSSQDDGGMLEALIQSWAAYGGMAPSDWLHLTTDEQKSRLHLAQRLKAARRLIWLEAWERTYEAHLKNLISEKVSAPKTREQPPVAQFAFCLDVRSEAIRRHLEETGPFETFGTAGFFGLPIKARKLGKKRSHSALPVMLKPQYKIEETLPDLDYRDFQKRADLAESPKQTFETLKYNMPSGLLLPEISGPWLALHSLASSFIPETVRKWYGNIHKRLVKTPKIGLTLDRCCEGETDLPLGFSDEEKVFFARQALVTMGLTENFAPLVVICGHEGETVNNPHATALDCSACGGASSTFNARVLVALCNLPEVREKLKTTGIIIPEETVFVAAKHVTTTDELQWLDVPDLSPEAQSAFDRVEKVLPKVTEQLGRERLPLLPTIVSVKERTHAEAEKRAKDWSEIRPEWALAGNAAFIIGERSLTKGRHLEGRVFLHNYQWQKDRNGELLANIIKGPVTVAQWINLQYYASTVAPHYYGSGNKITQTVTSGIGVMQGNGSDLLTGLPWQSVMASDTAIYHEPLRLLTVIQAPTESIQRILDHDPDFRQKLKNGWLRLATIDPDGNWISWS